MTLPEADLDAGARWLPSPDEIAAAVAEIQREWSPRERAKRMGKQHCGVEVPRVRSAVAEPAATAE